MKWLVLIYCVFGLFHISKKDIGKWYKSTLFRHWKMMKTKENNVTLIDIKFSLILCTSFLFLQHLYNHTVLSKSFYICTVVIESQIFRTIKFWSIRKRFHMQKVLVVCCLAGMNSLFYFTIRNKFYISTKINCFFFEKSLIFGNCSRLFWILLKTPKISK